MTEEHCDVCGWPVSRVACWYCEHLHELEWPDDCIIYCEDHDDFHPDYGQGNYNYSGKTRPYSIGSKHPLWPKELCSPKGTAGKENIAGKSVESRE